MGKSMNKDVVNKDLRPKLLRKLSCFDKLQRFGILREISINNLLSQATKTCEKLRDKFRDRPMLYLEPIRGQA